MDYNLDEYSVNPKSSEVVTKRVHTEEEIEATVSSQKLFESRESREFKTAENIPGI